MKLRRPLSRSSPSGSAAGRKSRNRTEALEMSIVPAGCVRPETEQTAHRALDHGGIHRTRRRSCWRPAYPSPKGNPPRQTASVSPPCKRLSRPDRDRHRHTFSRKPRGQTPSGVAARPPAERWHGRSPRARWSHRLRARPDETVTQDELSAGLQVTIDVLGEIGGVTAGTDTGPSRSPDRRRGGWMRRPRHRSVLPPSALTASYPRN